MIGRGFALDLVQAYGSPLYTYDLDAVSGQAKRLRSSLPERSALFYSLKANPNVSVARAARHAGCRAEVSSLGELRAALAAGYLPGSLLYTGPGKGTAEIEAALRADVTFFSGESTADLVRIREAALRTGVRADALIRVNPVKSPRSSLVMSGGPSQFGTDEEDLIGGRIRWPSSDRHLRVRGLHVYLGSQITPLAALVDAFAAGLEAVIRVFEANPFECDVVDLGGGFAWPYATQGDGEDLSCLRKRLTGLLDSHRHLAGAEVWFESGRYIAASSGTYLATVMDVKASRGRTYVVLDGGINHLGGMSGLGRIPRGSMAFVPMRTTDVTREPVLADVVGPLCSPLDCLGRNVALPAVAPGDLLAIPNVGAYGLSASLVGFLSRQPPAEVAYRGETVEGVDRMQSARWPDLPEAGTRT